MAVKQPLNLNSPQALAQATGGVVRPLVQPGQRPAALQDDTQKDYKGKIREGHNKAFHDTFGAGSFDANVGDGNSYAGDMTISDATYGGHAEEHYESKQKEMQYIEASFRAADIALGGDGNPYTLDDHSFHNSYYDDYGYGYQDYYSAPIYDSYTGTFDTSDPRTAEYVERATLSFNEEGKLTSIDDGVSCLRADKKGGRAEALLNALAEGGPQNLTNKVDEVKAAVATQDGYLMFDGQRIHANSPNGKQIILAQQQLAAGVEPTALQIKNILNQSPEELAAAKKGTLDLGKIPGTSPDEIFIATGSPPKAGPEQNAPFQSMMAKTISPAVGQGGDLFMVTKALKDNNFSQMSKPSELSASTTSPTAAEPTPPPLGSTIMKPAAPAPVFAI